MAALSPRRRTLHTPERLVRQSLRAWLDLHKIPYVPVEARKPLRDAQGRVFFVSEQPQDRGIADFIAFYGGRHRGGWIGLGGRMVDLVVPVAIEAKASNGRQREAQHAWQSRWESFGFIYILARSVDDLKKSWPVLL